MPIIQPSSLPLHELALFAGAGGGILGGLLCGFQTVCAVEINEYARNVLLARQDDGCLEPFPVWDDVTTFDGKPWRGVVDIVTGGFPCQDISAAGTKTGLEGARSGLWKEMARIIGEVRPRFVLVENSPDLTFRGGLRVVGDLARLGYDARWGIVGARHAGAPHHRDRIWILADSDGGIVRASGPAQEKAGAANVHQHGIGSTGQLAPWWAIQPEPCSVVHGMAGLVDMLRPFGNGQVPAVVRLAWDLLKPMES